MAVGQLAAIHLSEGEMRMMLRTLHPEALARLNSLTKYPSIETYHTLGKKGELFEPAMQFPGDVIVTEKVDGTNGRIVVLPSGEWLIGSREEFFTACGDLVYNPGLGIVDALRPVAEKIRWYVPGDGQVFTYYFEVFGAGIGQNAKNYTTSKMHAGVRLFDIGVTYDTDVKMAWNREHIASWRDHGGQSFVDEWRLDELCGELGLARVPYLFQIPGDSLPQSVEDMHEFLMAHISATRTKLDDTGRGRAEGLVIRSLGRAEIGKARFEDYERTVRYRLARSKVSLEYLG